MKNPVGQVVFVRLDVVDLAEHLRYGRFGAPGERWCRKQGAMKGGPVLQQHEVGPVAADLPPDPPPVERIDRMDAAGDVQIGRRRGRHGLALPGKEQRRILQREGPDQDLVATAQEVRAMISMIEPNRPDRDAPDRESLSS